MRLYIQLCAFVEVRSIGKIDQERNPKTMAALTDSVASLLSVPRDRVFINLDDISPNNWGALGNVVA
jgi:phenylpyruvate tautomerase PptA (4-oxalocrotonate tautomerase family)